MFRGLSMNSIVKKKVLLFLVVLIVALPLFFFLLIRRPSVSVDVEENSPELPFDQRPFTQLIPSKDGHYLKMIVSNFNVPGAYSMDYELYYDTAEGITQGVPGKVKLNGLEKIERELLLGSESSGKFRYDQGVDDGTLTLRFRDNNGKLIGKISGQWSLSKGGLKLSSLDGRFTYTLENKSDNFFVVMPTFGIPESFPAQISTGPYGVFASTPGPYKGDVSLGENVYAWYGNRWEKLSGSSEDVGVFVTAK